MKLLLTMCLIFFSTSVMAACTPVKLNPDNKSIFLTADKDLPKVYFFHNTSKQGIWLDHPVQRGMNAGWSSYVRTGNWSAFLLDRKNFELTCATIQPGAVNYLNCPQVVTVCSNAVTSTKKLKGTYWLAEDKSWDELIKAIAKREVMIVK